MGALNRTACATEITVLSAVQTLQSTAPIRYARYSNTCQATPKTAAIAECDQVQRRLLVSLYDAYLMGAVDRKACAVKRAVLSAAQAFRIHGAHQVRNLIAIFFRLLYLSHSTTAAVESDLATAAGKSARSDNLFENEVRLFVFALGRGGRGWRKACGTAPQRR